jgi:hypothetical protein
VAVVINNTVLSNFSRIGRLELLRALLGKVYSIVMEQLAYLTDKNGQLKAVVVPIGLRRQLFLAENVSCEFRNLYAIFTDNASNL